MHMETGETCLYNKKHQKQTQGGLRYEKENDDGTDGIHGLSTVLGAAGTAKADEDLYGFEEPVTIKIGYSWGKDFSWKSGRGFQQ